MRATKENSNRLDAQASSAWELLNASIVECRRCPRLIEHCRTIGRVRRRAYRDQEYWAQPVPNFGCAPAPLLIVGLAPGAHGANRTGRMFTGDQSGDWLFRALHGAGLATQAASTHRGDALRLIDCAISAVCHCAPPDNKPAVEEIVQCRPWLEQTMRVVRPRIILALGHIGWNSVIQYAKSQNWLTVRGPRFAHGHCVNLTREITLLGSYHPSQQNTFTGRLTERMLNDIMRTARDLIDKARNERLGRGELPSVITDPRIEKSLE